MSADVRRERPPERGAFAGVWRFFFFPFLFFPEVFDGVVDGAAQSKPSVAAGRK